MRKCIEIERTRTSTTFVYCYLTFPARAMSEKEKEMERVLNSYHMVSADKSECVLVLKELKRMERGRKAFRIVDGIVLEQTVHDVMLELENRAESMTAMIKAHEDRIKTIQQVLNIKKSL
ncbi:MAG: prefoldin subunit 2 [Amphiamblys sp. WSBS2006]|nr:MAG: prefoldin subunit 2 [Amphiamblys sp. WSBS2006]